MPNFIFGRADAERAVQLAHDLNLLLRGALTEQDDGAEVVDIPAWKDAGVPAALRALSPLVDRVQKRLES